MICEKCNGSGIISEGLDSVCEECGGTGQVGLVEEVVGVVVEEESFLDEAGEDSDLSSDEE